MSVYIRSPGYFALWRPLTMSLIMGLTGAGSVAPLWATNTVSVDKSPLSMDMIVPPNIVLILDDSKSMLQDFMPDWSYLTNTTEKGLINSNNNGMYYNPDVIYSPPPKNNSTPSHPDYFQNQDHITLLPVNGFKDDSSTVDLTHYDGSFEMENKIHYSASKDFSGPNGLKTFHYFQYATGPANGPYSVHYVASTAQGCGSLDGKTTPTCVTADTAGDGTNGAPTGVSIGKNIGNWYAYYHTRLLAAKSGLMMALMTLNKKYRFGFTAINHSTISKVQPFGDGSKGTDRKSQFWQWLIKKKASGATPLRKVLNAVGLYYKTDQPWTTMSSDPGLSKVGTELACRQSFAILTSDGFWNGSDPLLVGDEDGTNGLKITGPNGKNYTYKPVLPYRDSATSSYSKTLADVAMKYWKNDLRDGVVNQVPTSNHDPAFWQHMATFTIGLGQKPTYVHNGITSPIPMNQIFAWAEGIGGAALSGFEWPQPLSDTLNNIADLAHAAVNGHGGFYSVRNPGEIIAAFKNILNHIQDRLGSRNSLSTSPSKSGQGQFVYQSHYFTGNWNGDLKAFKVNTSDGSIEQIATWSAADVLPRAVNRHIYTCNPDASGSPMVAFKKPASLSTAQQNALGSDTTSQQKVLNYLRGDNSQEKQISGGLFRDRKTPLGDIVHSQPLYIGEINTGRFNGRSFSGSNLFAAYAQANKNRKAMLYVAANDGMLHAFGAADGIERFAYIPAAVITDSTNTTGTTQLTTGSSRYVGLSALANPDYGTGSQEHEYFNDGELTVADAYFAAGKDAVTWHTVLVGTTGRGLARTVYALDVTDPDNIKLLWERSANDKKNNSNYIGQITGKPVIAQVGDGQWAVLIGNGYNSTAGVSALLQFNLANGDLGVHKTKDTMTGNGLSAPVVWIGDVSHGISTIAYAGDLHGKVWSFPVSQKTGGKRITDTTSNGTLLFKAVDSSGKVQPITGGMLAGLDPVRQNRWIFFGTGQYLARNDAHNKAIQTWYGLIVHSTADSTLVNKLINNGNGVGNSNLVQRHIIYEKDAQAADPASGKKEKPAVRVISTAVAGDMNGKSGWFLNLGQLDTPVVDLLGLTTYTTTYPHAGERMVSPNQFKGKVLIGTTLVPDDFRDACHLTGSGWIMALDPFTGSAISLGSFDANGDGSSDTVEIGGKHYVLSGLGFDALPNNPVFIGDYMMTNFDDGRTKRIHTFSHTQLTRVSWRELEN